MNRPDLNNILFNIHVQRELGAFNFKTATLGDVVSALVPILFVTTGLILLLFLVWGGFGIMTSGGDPKAMEAAKAKITNAITGFVIIFVAFWLVQLLGLIFGISQFRQIF